METVSDEYLERLAEFAAEPLREPTPELCPLCQQWMSDHAPDGGCDSVDMDWDGMT